MINGWRRLLVLFLILNALTFVVSAQSGRTTPRPPGSDDDTERVFVEEIKVNVAAFNTSGSFFEGVRPEDLVINEDGVLHQPASVRRIPASVLIVLDTGGLERQAKDLRTTRNAAKKLINGLQKDDRIGIIEYHDDARVLAEWTDDREFLITQLDKHLRFGRRSRFVKALDLAAGFFEKSNLENRHLVLITDGLDADSDLKSRVAALRELMTTDISVHVLSYTKMELDVVAQRVKSVSGGGRRRQPLPPGADIPANGQTPTFPILTVNLDREMIRKIRERGERLQTSEKELTELTKNTNGVLYLPESREDLVEKTSGLAATIDASYVVTYVPKRPLAGVRITEERRIEITSRRSGLDVLSSRVLIVQPDRRR